MSVENIRDAFLANLADDALASDPGPVRASSFTRNALPPMPNSPGNPFGPMLCAPVTCHTTGL